MFRTVESDEHRDHIDRLTAPRTPVRSAFANGQGTLVNEETDVDDARRMITSVIGLASESLRSSDQVTLRFTVSSSGNDSPASVTSQLSERAKSLRNQHVELYEEISCLAGCAADISFGNGYFQEFRQLARRFSDLHGRLQNHESQEDEWIVEAYNVDIGVGD